MYLLTFICADEKFKKLKDGTVNRYVYYGCSKSKDKKCKCGHIREKDLIEELTKIIDKVSLNKIGMKDKIKKEISQYQEFQQSVLQKKDKDDIKVKDVEIRNYAKYILKNRPIWEKRELLKNLRSELRIRNKEVYIE